MKKTFVVAAALGMFAVLIAAGSSKPTGDRGTEEAIMQLEERGLKAALKGDAAALEDLLADDYIGISGATGRENTEAEAVNNYKTGKLKYESLTRSEVKVHVFTPNTAMVTGKAEVKGKLGDQDLSGTYRFSRLYLKRGGKWQVATFQSTKIPGPGSS